ncbi:MAG: insulinase family protein [Elusimicrobia bacterium]|nr:insulinase family protein [Elusimicrobiota bacterium]
MSLIFLAFLYSTFNILHSPCLWAVPPNVPEPKPIDFKIPKPKRFELSNKMIVYFLEDNELPQIQMTAMIHGGSIADPAGKIGLASLFAAVLPYGGAKNIRADDLTKELELMASSISAGAGEESMSLDLFSLTKNFSRTLELFGQLLSQPSFDKAKLETEKKKTIAAIERRNDEPRQIVGREFKRMVYGPTSPWGWRIEAETIKRISRKDLLDFHRRHMRPENIMLAVSGNITQEKLRAELETAMGSGLHSSSPRKRGSSINEDLTPLPVINRLVYLVPKETAAQSAIRIGHLGIERHHPDFFKLKMLDEIMGGGFASRFFRNIRSRKGLAYSVGSSFSTPKVKGLLLAAIGTKPETTVKAVEEILSEIAALQAQPPTDEEISVAKNQLVNSFIQNFRTGFQTVSQAAQLEFFGYPGDYLDNYTANLSKVTQEEVRQTAAHHWRPESAVILVVGNPKKFDKDLSALGPVKIIDAQSGKIRDYVPGEFKVEK